MKLFYLFFAFVKIGLFSIGGGLATLPFLNELADKSDGWLTRAMVADMLAMAQSLPGAIGVNLSAYTGFRHAGIPGGFAAALGLVSPSIVIIAIVARVLQNFKENTPVQRVFAGFRPAAAGLVSAAGFGAIALSLWNAAAPVWYEYLRWKETILFILLFILVFQFKKHPIVYIAAAGGAGVILGHFGLTLGQ
jgi:chromate transporter